MPKGGNQHPNRQNTAPESGESPSFSEPYRRGRRLILRFGGEESPVLQRVEFQVRAGQADHLERDDSNKGFDWDKFAQALSLFFIRYRLWDLAGQRDIFYFCGSRRNSLAASLGDGIYGSNPFQDLFSDPALHKNDQKLLKKIFGGDYVGGKSSNAPERRITARLNQLPPDCVSIYWRPKGELTEVADLQLLEKRLCLSLGIPIEPAKPKTPKESLAPEPPPKPPVGEGSSPPPQTKPDNLKTDSPPTATELTGENPANQPEPSSSSIIPELIPFDPGPIDPKLFTVAHGNGLWPDDAPLISYGKGMDWTLRNAFEGVLILGATGSGKTSGSGASLAEAFLQAGFGGLILTVKTNEADHWRKLCARCGREQDLIVVRKGGPWSLNILAYEAQRPGQGGGLSANMVAFCRNLLSIAARNKGHGVSEQFWQSATDQLLNATFDLFLLAGGAITFDRLANFIAAAPTDKVPTTEAGWLKVPVFGSVLTKARAAVSSNEDIRILKRTTDYWFKIYPGLASKTRTSITLGVFALLDTFRGRDIPAIVSSDTNLTPESIMSGKIVILDLPLKEFGQTGLLVQSAWKYLFQMALERQANAGDPRRRPVFLWEDEGQYFFSEHDNRFQDTARSARVSRVILSQNLHNFYKEFGENGGAAANSVFGNLNTKIFHANTDPFTNEWASKHFGQVIRTRLTISQNPPPPSRGFFDSMRQWYEPTSNTGFSHGEQWEPAVRPEEFNCLRNGGRHNNFEVDAYVTWPGLADEDGHHYIKTIFQQNHEP